MAPVTIDPLIGGEPRSSADRENLPSVFGDTIADIGMAPRLSAQRVANQLRAAADGIPPDAEVFAAGAKLFATADIDGESYADYVHSMIAGTGLTRASVERAVADLVAGIEALPETVRAELPDSEFGAGRRTRWVPRGRVFAALMASNTPAPNTAWVQALFHGYAVAVRPGSRDPFTARRLVKALIQAGLPVAKIAYVPCAHDVGSVLVEQADRGIVYGGDSAVRKWRGSPVEVRGPGRSKALVDVPVDEDVLEHLVTSAAFDGGTRCTNLSAVLTSGSAPELADRLAERLVGLPTAPATDPEAVLLVADRNRAESIRAQLDGLREEMTDHTAALRGADPLEELADGSFALHPVVLSTDRADHPATGTELPFPFLVVAPWSEEDGSAPLRNSLVLNLLTGSARLVEDALREPSVRKVTEGRVLPWTGGPGIPHDGSFTQFLLEPKGVLSAS